MKDLVKEAKELTKDLNDLKQKIEKQNNHIDEIIKDQEQKNKDFMMFYKYILGKE